MAVIDACRQGGQWALAVALLREMSATPMRVPGEAAAAAAMSPTVEAYTAALTACGNAGQWEVAIGLLREVTDGDAVAATATAVNGGGGVDGDVRSAAAAAADDGVYGDAGASDKGEGEGGGGRRHPETESSSESVPLMPDLFLYNAAIEACGNAGQWERALELLSEISEIGLSPSVVR